MHTADSSTEVTAVESMGSGSTQIVAPEDNSSLNDGTGLNSLVNGSASEVESYLTAPTATLPKPDLGDINDTMGWDAMGWGWITLGPGDNPLERNNEILVRGSPLGSSNED